LNAIYSPADFLTLYAPEDINRLIGLYAPEAKENPDAQRSLEKLITKLKEKGATLRQKAEEIRIVTKTAEGALTSDCVEFQQFSFKVIWDGAVAEVLARLPLPYPYGNVVLLQRVLVNLFMNAAEASGGKPDFEIVTRGEYKEMNEKMGAFIEVRDNGVGIPSAVLNKIFDQGFSTKPKPKPHEKDASGYGQGLWVCKQTIEEIHKGKLWVESEAGKGTCFFFWLPFGEGCIQL
jgi:signal transduction histidine kinase